MTKLVEYLAVDIKKQNKTKLQTSSPGTVFLAFIS